MPSETSSTASASNLPSGRFPANGAWLQVLAHNLARWTARIVGEGW